MTEGLTPKLRLERAAFELFEEKGFDNTTVDDIAQRAGVGRTTFFRSYPSKEDVIFPEHEAVLSRMQVRLETAVPSNRRAALVEAAKVVLDAYLAEGELARVRYRLTQSVPALRAREVSSMRRYQILFTRHLREWMAGEADAELRAEVLAAAIVAGHNHTLRRWLRGDSEDPEQEFFANMELVIDRLNHPGSAGDAAVVVVQSQRTADDVADRVRRALDD